MLQVTKESFGEATLWHCAGQLVRSDDSKNFLERVTSTANRRVLLDLAEVDSVDASGIGVLVALLRWCRDHGSQLTLMNPSSRLREILRLTKLDTIFELCTAEPCSRRAAFSATCA